MTGTAPGACCTSGQDRLDRKQVRQIKAVGKLVELNDNNVAHNYLPQPDGRFLRHYRVRAMIHAAG